jgi:hypothetical protein
MNDHPLHNLDDERTGFTLLAIYDLVDGYDGFCGWLDLDPGAGESRELYDAVHAAYVDAWKLHGHDQFERQLRLHREYL